MRKILFVIGSLQSGGAERVASVLTGHWAENGMSITLVTGTDADSDFYPVHSKIKRLSLGFDYPEKGFGKKLIEQIRRLLLVERFLKKRNFDITITSSTDISLRFAFHYLFRKGALFICEHNNYDAPQSKFKIKLRSYLFKRATKLLVLTDRDRLKYIANGFSKDKVEVMLNPLGVTNEGSFIRTNKDKVRYKLLAVARLTKQKSLDRMIDIFCMLDERYTLTIAGDGPLRGELEKQVSMVGISQRVTFTGNVSDVASLYRNHEVLLMTSIYEGLPMVISEANSFGLPVVSFNCPTGPAEMIADGKNGYLVNDGDYSDFAEKVTLLYSDESKFYNMQQHSLDASKKYSIDVISKNWLSIFNQANN